jgi:hypothetical protein
MPEEFASGGTIRSDSPPIHLTKCWYETRQGYEHLMKVLAEINAQQEVDSTPDGVLD